MSTLARTTGIYIQNNYVTAVPDGVTAEIQIFSENQNYVTDTPVATWPLSVEGGQFVVDIPYTTTATYPDTIQIAIVVTPAGLPSVRRLVEGPLGSVILERLSVNFLITPTPGSVLVGDTQTFTWNLPAGVESSMRAGSVLDAADYYNGGALIERSGQTATGLPVDGSTVYVRVVYRPLGGTSDDNQYVYVTYTAFDLASVTISTATATGGLEGSI